MAKRWLLIAGALLLVATFAGAVIRLTLDTPGNGVAGPTPTASPTPVPADATAPPSPSLAEFYGQDLDWSTCHDSFLCATVTVPMDYATPGGATIKIALLKVPATDPAHRIGSLVVNPGGPGASGADFAQLSKYYFGDAVRARYDIVGFDPRGTGQSDPIRCVSDEEMTALLSSDPDPDTAAEGAAYQRAAEDFGRGCAQAGPLAAHVSTVEAARDMDILRAALGETRLTYFGASYGTKLGTTYADLFPKRVGRFVLDGAVDPKIANVQMILAQAAGFETALRAYAAHCVRGGGCFLGQTVDAAVARIGALVQSVEVTPLPAGARQLAGGDAFTGVLEGMYSTQQWPQLDAALKQAFAGDGTLLMGFADQFAGRNGETYLNNFVQAGTAITCLDDPSAVPAAKIPALYPQFEKVAPTFAKAFAWIAMGCIGQVATSDAVAPPIGAPGAAPIVVIGTTRDPATPYQWAVNLARDLSSGVLITRDGDGHTGYHSGNQCVDRAVESYLVDGTVPGDGLRC